MYNNILNYITILDRQIAAELEPYMLNAIKWTSKAIFIGKYGKYSATPLHTLKLKTVYQKPLKRH